MEAQGRTQRGSRCKRKLMVPSQANTVGCEPNIAAQTLGEKTVVVRDDRPQKVEVAKGSRQIVVSLDRAEYDRIWKDPRAVRQLLEAQREQFPELFPAQMDQGYHLCGMLPESIKLSGVRLRQIKLKADPQVKYTLRPSFVAPYLVGTTLRASGKVPEDLSADEASLTAAYGEFRDEARDVQPNYSPSTVNTDGWPATRAAWSGLFPSIVLILCFLHGFLKIRDRCRKNHELHSRVWDVYRAPTAVEFRRELTELDEWSSSQDLPAPVRQAITKLVKHADSYAVSYDHPTGKRTSNEVDRLTNHLTRLMYSGKHLHGYLSSATLRLRGAKLVHNFLPFAERSNHPRERLSPAHRLNNKVFHQHWLHNLFLSASMRGIHART